MTTISLTMFRLSAKVTHVPLLVALLALLPLLYAGLLVGGGLDDLNMVRHFAEEDQQLYEFHGQYEEGPLYAPLFHNMNVYPKAFYNTAGVFLYPYAALQGEDFEAVLMTWRVLNMLAGMGAVVVIFFLGRYVFRSDAVAFLGAFIYALTPQFLRWMTSVRPNPLEQLLIFATLLLCARLLVRFSYRTFLIATLLGALTFSTKYGGWLFVGLLPALAVYLGWRSQRSGYGWADVVHKQVRLFQAVAPFLIAIAVLLGTGFGWLLFTHSWDTVALILAITDSAFPADKLARAPVYLERWRWLINIVAFGGLVALGIIIIVLAAAWRAFKKWDPSMAIRPNATLYVALAGWLAAQVILIYGLVLFATSPVYLANPDFFVSQFGYMVYYVGLGGSYGSSGQPTFVESFQTFASQFHFGWIAFAILLAYAGYRELSGKTRPDTRKDQRAFLWLFAIIVIAMALGSRNPHIRHILPALGILYLFVADAIVPWLPTISWPRIWRAAWLASVPAIVLLAVLAGFHAREAFDYWEFRHSRPEDDTGIQVGSWLLESYPPNTRIMTDWGTFYVPPAFTHAASVTEVQRRQLLPDQKRQVVSNAIASFDPDVLIVTHPQGFESFISVLPLFSSEPILKSRNYRLVKRFDYNDAERQRYRYTEVLVYEKGSRR